MIYTTHKGVTITLERVSRRELDAIFVQLPQPIPPTKTRTVWGGIEEEYLDYKDELFRDLYTCWLISLSDRQLEVMAQGIVFPFEIHDDPFFNEAKLALGFHGNDKADYLRYVAFNDIDFVQVTQKILYLSTVTQQAIDEASAVFAVEWNTQPIDSWAVKKSQGKYSALFEHRQAARFALLPWPQFCELDGPEQSAVVAHYRLSNRLEWLEINSNK